MSYVGHKTCFRFILLLFVISITLIPQISSVLATSSEKEIGPPERLDFNSFENITVLENGTLNQALLWNLPASPLAELYKKALAAPNTTDVEEEVEIPENITVESNLKVGANITLKELNVTKTLIPVRETFYEALSKEAQYSLGLNTSIIGSGMVPRGRCGEFRVYVNAYGYPKILDINKSGADDIWNLHIGPTNSSIFMEYILTKIAFIRLFLESLSGEQTYIGSSIVKINLPTNATLLNYDELSGVKWFVNISGGTYLEASLSVDNVIVLNETMVVTEANLTKTLSELCTELQHYKSFNIKYALPYSGTTLADVQNPDVNEDFEFRKSITFVERTASWTVSVNGFSASLTAYSKLGVEVYVGWEPTIPIPYINPLQWFEAWIKPEATASITFDAMATTSFSESWSWPLFEDSRLFTIFINGLPVPVMVDVHSSLTASLEVSFDGKLEISTGAEASGWLKAGVRWDDTGWHKIWEPHVEVNYVKPTIEYEAHALIKASLTPRIEVLFYMVAGPFAEFPLYASAEVTLHSTMELNIKIGMDINAGVTFEEHLRDLLGLSDYSWSIAKFVFKEWSWKWRHDIAITNVRPSPTKVYVGENVNIYVEVENRGNFTEAFSVTVYYNTNPIGPPKTSTLNSGEAITLDFIWETTKVSPGTYTIKAEASTVPNEEDTSDNTYIDGTVEILPVYHNLKISTTDGGTTSPSPGTYSYSAGETVTVTALPYSGYKFDHWMLDGTTKTENPITITMNRDYTLTAYFRRVEYTLTIATTAGGTTNPAPGSYKYPEGTSVTVTAIPNAGYEFDHWILDGMSRTENPITIVTNKDYTLTAYFRSVSRADLTITNVWWTPASPVEGDTITIYVTEANIGDANAGTHTDRIIVNGSPTDFRDPGLAAGTSRTFSLTISNAVKGTYHIKVILDVNNDVTEKDETNNVWEGEITVAGWVPYVPTPEQTEIEISTIAGITYAEVTLTFPDTGYRVTDWGTISRTDNEFSADAQVERWTGVSTPTTTELSHTYELGTLPPDTYTFTFKAWGTIVESQEFTITPPGAGVEVSIDPTTASTELKHSVEYTIYVHNTGVETDTYDVTVVGIDSSWYSLSATSVTVEPDQTVEVTLTITPPCSALTYEEKETYPFTVNATSQTDPSIFDTVDAELTVYITWEYIYEDPVRHTTLKISTDNKCFRFITPDKDYGIRRASSMYEGYVTVYYNGQYVSLPAVIIRHNDSELRLLAYAGTEVPFCYARAVDYQTGNRYMIRIDPSTPA